MLKIANTNLWVRDPSGNSVRLTQQTEMDTA